ncbi:MAG: polyphosphate kinase 2 family protein [Candidatus Cybelea sp.]
MSFRKRFEVRPKSQMTLSEIDSETTGKHKDKAAASSEMKRDDRRLANLQYLLYAEHRRSLLVVLQGMDASGKDGIIRHVFGALDPQGARVHAFKEPSQEEADHDFLWRAHVHAPAKGELVIFNRSHYEDVLIVRVHDLVPESVWSRRYELINEFERNLTLAGTTILKFYLYITEKEQLRRFEKRLDDPARQWKISDADYKERAYFPEYVRAYEDVLNKTSTVYAPWFVIPSRRKWFRNLAVSKIVVETLKSFDMRFPPPAVDIRQTRREFHAAEAKEKT